MTRRLQTSIAALFLLSTLNAKAREEKVIYGSDNRLDVYQSANPLYKKLASSTAAMISNSSLVDLGNYVSLEGKTLEDDINLCSDERFAKQMAVANCSGFLVGKQYLATAGHCIKSLADCENNVWVFGYANTNQEESNYQIPKTEIYKCTEIIEREFDYITLNDFSLVKLDREVTNHAPLKFRKKRSIEWNTNLVVIGHPSRLPTKIADGANVRNIDNPYYFTANLDTFGGNSGSAVFDAKTGLVEGILVRGEQDYMESPTNQCMRPMTCAEKDCRGEDVTRITNIQTLKRL